MIQYSRGANERHASYSDEGSVPIEVRPSPCKDQINSAYDEQLRNRQNGARKTQCETFSAITWINLLSLLSNAHNSIRRKEMCQHHAWHPAIESSTQCAMEHVNDNINQPVNIGRKRRVNANATEYYERSSVLKPRIHQGVLQVLVFPSRRRKAVAAWRKVTSPGHWLVVRLTCSLLSNRWHLNRRTTIINDIGQLGLRKTFRGYGCTLYPCNDFYTTKQDELN